MAGADSHDWNDSGFFQPYTVFWKSTQWKGCVFWYNGFISFLRTLYMHNNVFRTYLPPPRLGPLRSFPSKTLPNFNVLFVSYSQQILICFLYTQEGSTLHGHEVNWPGVMPLKKLTLLSLEAINHQEFLSCISGLMNVPLFPARMTTVWTVFKSCAAQLQGVLECRGDRTHQLRWFSRAQEKVISWMLGGFHEHPVRSFRG